jgi:hypothetical protein
MKKNDTGPAGKIPKDAKNGLKPEILRASPEAYDMTGT